MTNRKPRNFNPIYGHISREDGEAILGRTLNLFKSKLSAHPAVRQGMPPGSIRQTFDTEPVVEQAMPGSAGLQKSVAKALHEKSGWTVDADDLNAAVERWLDARLEECLEEIWTSRRFITVRVTRHEISIETCRGPAGSSVGSLPA